MNNYFRGTVQPTITDIWPDETTFLDQYFASPFFKEGQLEYATLTEFYWKFLAAYPANTFRYDDVATCQLKVFGTVSQYLPNMQKKLSIQQRIVDMEEREIMRSGSQVSNFANNPDTDPPNDAEEALNLISSQNYVSKKLNAIDALGRQFMSIVDGLWDELLARFRDFFALVLIDVCERLFVTDEDDFINGATGNIPTPSPPAPSGLTKDQVQQMINQSLSGYVRQTDLNQYVLGGIV